MYLYLILNIASFTIPFAYSFEKKMNFIRLWKPIFLSLSIVGLFFIAWDIIFTQQGVWGFNPKYHVGLNILGLPLEELLFFICIPYASIFTHYALNYFFKTLCLPSKTTKTLTYILLFISVITLIYAYPKLYTTVNLSLFILLLMYSIFKGTKLLSKFYISFLVILIPFFIVNGILTGSFIHQEVVWYNNNDNLNIRLFTIPIEDLFYAFNLIYLNLLLIAYFSRKFNLKYQNK